MTISDLRIPEIHRFIARWLAEQGGRYEGTNQICDQLPADPRSVRDSLRQADKYQLIRKSKDGHCGRGHKSTWTLTRKGWQYAKS